MPKTRGLKRKNMWAIFSPDGYLQVRSIGYTAKESKANIATHDAGWKEYAEFGYTISKIIIDIKVIN